MRLKIALLCATLLTVSTAHAGEKSLSQSLSFFGGVFSESSFPGTANIPLGGKLESNYNFGAIYNRDFIELGAGFYLGGEVGASIRAGQGEPTSGEIWAGASFRHSGLDLGPLNIAPRFTIGFSAVSHTIGVETQRADVAGTEGTLLVYLGPEIALSFKQLPKTEFFYRTHHRSGALKTFENMEGGHNAHIFGVRRNF